MQTVQAWRFHAPLTQLCMHNNQCSSKLQKFLSKKIWTKDDRQEILNTMADLFLLGGDCVEDLCIWFGPLLLEILARSTESILYSGHLQLRLLKKMAVVMCRGFPINELLVKFARDFVRHFNPFTTKDTDSEEPPPEADRNNEESKEACVDARTQISDLDWCHAMWSYMRFLPEFATTIDLTPLEDYLSCTDPLVKWYASLALSRFHAFSSSEEKQFLIQHFPPAEQSRLSMHVSMQVSALVTKFNRARQRVELVLVDSLQSNTLHTIQVDDLCAHVVSVGGVLLPKVRQAATAHSQENVNVQPPPTALVCNPDQLLPIDYSTPGPSGQQASK
ncbi:unnamed protein product [Candidula unifasciata]|uniref:Uncharacterized protein n=1 Tax=Candidula unifasciata TaxID=100452 RepID=A0A8S3ZI78_9EUPU|nr:unnamed protein product [Candidula unifasciata]